MTDQSRSNELWRGNHLHVASRNTWEYVSRNTMRPAVAIVALTSDRQVILIEQFRPPVDRRILEIPAGLSGDVAGAESESLLEAARRELLEETGYVSKRWTELASGFSSAGLTDETVTIYLAEEIQKVGPGGGDESEDIDVHVVDLDGVLEWIRGHGVASDLKLMAGLFAAQAHLASR